jgi:hypothetical protein
MPKIASPSAMSGSCGAQLTRGPADSDSAQPLALAYHRRTTRLLAAEWSLRAGGKARSLKVLLRTPVAASAISAEACAEGRSFSFVYGTGAGKALRPNDGESERKSPSAVAIRLRD